MKKLKLTYSSHRNISNRHSPDYINLPEDWAEYSREEKESFVDFAYIWSIVVDAEEVDEEEDD